MALTLNPLPKRVAMNAGRSGGTPPKGSTKATPFSPGTTTRGYDVKACMKTNDFKILGSNTGKGDVM